MTSPHVPVTHTNANTVASVTPSSANPSTAGAVVSSNTPNQITAATSIHSMADLRKKAPKLYQMMLQGIGMSIVGEMQRHQARLKRLMRSSQ